MRRRILCFIFACLMHPAALLAYDITDATGTINRISPAGIHEPLGTIRMRQTAAALEINVDLKGLSPGWHAFHIHENGNCAAAFSDGAMVAGAAAGPHFDPTGVMRMSNMAAQLPKMDQSSYALGVSESVPKMIVPETKRATALKGIRRGSEMGAKEPVLSPPGRKPRPKGDLPALFTNSNGETRSRILSYKLKLTDVRGRSVMIHAYGEAPKDLTKPRGGGPRIACGVIP